MNYQPPKCFRERKERWTVGVDALPLVHLQSALDGKQEVYSLNAHVSTVELTGKQEDNLPHLDLSFKKSTMLQNRTLVTIGSEDPRDQFRKPMQEVFDDITKTLGIEQAVIENCGIVHQNKNMDHINCLDGIQEIYSHHQRYSNKSSIIARTLNFRIANPRRLIVPELFKRGVISTPRDEILKRLRSIMATDYFEFDDSSKGYDILHPKALEVQKCLKGSKYWKFIAVPERTRLFSNSNAVTKAIYMYRIDELGELFAF